MSLVARTVVVFVSIFLFAFVMGNLSGFYFFPRLYPNVEEHDDHEAGEEDEEDHLALTEQAFKSLDIKLGNIIRDEYWKPLTVPGEVIEIPGASDLSVSAPVSGLIEQVHVREGQAVESSDQLVSMRIIDDDLTDAQSKLLDNLSRQDVARREIARLAPLTESGTVTGRRKLDLEYELSQLGSTFRTLSQEILARGLPRTALQDLIENKVLATELSLAVPAFIDLPSATPLRPVSIGGVLNAKDFSIEELLAHPGKMVQRGDDLCNLAYHTELYIRGRAFETDMPALAKIAENGWRIRAEFGHEQANDHSHRLSIEGLELLHVDNHVDKVTQTFSFYLPIVNEVEKQITDEYGRIYQQWKYKPGQRVHLSLPVDHWEDALQLPRDAVVIEGPNAFVFVEHIDPHMTDTTYAHSDSDHAHEDDHDDHAHEGDHDHHVHIEFEPVPVQVLYRDANVVVLADDGQLNANDRIAMNNADKLDLAMKMQASGGGGHHHDHDH